MYLQKCAQFNLESGGEGIALMVYEDWDEKRVGFFSPIIYLGIETIIQLKIGEGPLWRKL